MSNNQTLDEIIKNKFSGISTKRLIATMESGKENIDDESYELNRRLKKTNQKYKFTEGDKIEIINL